MHALRETELTPRFLSFFPRSRCLACLNAASPLLCTPVCGTIWWCCAYDRRPQSPEEHEQTKEVVDSFLKNEGPELHERLKEYASTRASYIEEWWTES
jgi:hypothetical protein